MVIRGRRTGMKLTELAAKAVAALKAVELAKRELEETGSYDFREKGRSYGQYIDAVENPQVVIDLINSYLALKTVVVFLQGVIHADYCSSKCPCHVYCLQIQKVIAETRELT
jgi:hypothetical protein